MSYLLELLAKGLDANVGEAVQRHLRLGSRRPVAELEQLCRQHPDRGQLWCQLGLAYLQAMRFAEAAEHLRQACHHQPGLLAARLALAAACDELGRSAEALDHLRTANQTHPGSPDVLFACGYCLEKLCRPAEAAEYYRDVLELREEFAPAMHRLAAIALLRDDVDEAIVQYERLRHLSGGDTSVRATLAHLYHRGGRQADAISEFETVIAMEPENWALMDEEVETLVAGGHVREAMERLYKLLEVQGPFADLHLRLADLLSREGRDAEATSHYLAALDCDGDYLEAKIRLGGHHLANQRWAEAAEAFHEAVETNDELLACYVGLGVAESAAGKKDRALATFQLAGAVEPNSAMLLREMAKTQLLAAAAEEFERNFRFEESPPLAEPEIDDDRLLQTQVARHGEYVRRHGEYPDVRYRYGVLLRAEGRLGEALEQFEAAVRINPAYVDAIIRLGITQQDLGRIDEAVETFRRALDLKGEYVDLHYRLAALYTDRHEFAEAVEHMEKAADLAPGNRQIRASLALSLQNMGLTNRAAATWRSLTEMHRRAAEGEPQTS